MFTALLVSLVAGADLDPAVLQKVTERTKALEAYLDNATTTIDVTAEELDGDGKVKSTEESIFRVTRQNGETVKRELLKQVEDGKDVTDDAKKELAEEPKKKNGKGKSLSAMSPFHPSQVAKYRFGLLAPPADNPALVRVAFQPAGEKEPELLIGDATLDPATGDVLSLSMRPSKNPRFVDSLTMEAEMKGETPAGRAMSKLVAKGAGGIAFIKKRFRVVTTITYE